MTTLVAKRAHIQRLFIIVALFAGLAWILGAFAASSDLETLRALVVLSLLIILSLVVFWLVARSDPEGPTLFTVLLVSFALKLGAAYYRLASGLLADAYVYSAYGVTIAEQLVRGEWPGSQPGSAAIRLATGLVYLVTGPSLEAITILWAWLALIGMLLFYKAFIVAFPRGNRRLYLFLVLLFPSVLLWTSSLGKDAPMMLFSGMATYGLARSRKGLDIGALSWLLAGIAGMYAVRPHIAAAFTVAVGASLVIHPVSAGRMKPAIRLATLLALGAAAIMVAITASRLVGLERLEFDEVQEFIGERQGYLTGTRHRVVGPGESGASTFTPVNPKNPLGFAILITTVLFRPFPWEAHNPNALVTAMEGLALMVLVGYRFRSVRAAIVGAGQNSFLLTSVLYTLMVIYMFSAFANFGIVARQRVQIFPFVFMWIAYLVQGRRPEED